MNVKSTFKIKFVKNQPEIAAEPSKTLMQNLLDAGLPVASSCGGDGVCAKCRIGVIEGSSNLSHPNSTEVLLRDRHLLKKDERVSCQVQILGDVTIDTPYW